MFADLPWTTSLSGSYNLPYDFVLAAKYAARAGDPMIRDLSVTGPVQRTTPVRVAERGDDRAETSRSSST